ncbi:uncharacterized protein DUF4270 [Lutibacter sp. Hel_I_33_5]|uniref:DUF4270 family protein n=1 Tax=Lutibacter sp. Hel_I_33_5 TaxID=1566289 RepID=UPI0011A23D4E|nr:DUF4270 family protein [Lutibacter sp. Hel_I_33_5]TVZ56302.1 uncharacterized protein DUF4270 [Lutibacter sp. Hel_I_33_5]
MLKNIVKKATFVGVFAFVFMGVISCEEDFTDIGTSIINNTEFSTHDTILEVEVSGSDIDFVRADGITLQNGILGQYLLGVYNNANYEKIEASIVSQLAINTGYRLIQDSYTNKADTSVFTSIDSAILRIPYQSTLKVAATNDYFLDSIIGNQTLPFDFNVYQTSTFLNSLNPTDPSKTNVFNSDAVYDKVGTQLNSTQNYQFIPNKSDTVFYLNRTLKDGSKFIDTIRISNNRPFARIPLSKQKIKALFLDKYQGAEFATQENFNDYFRGIILEAKGSNGSLLSLNLNGVDNSSIEVYYTNTVTKTSTNKVIDTVLKNDSFALSGIRNNIYKMSSNNSPNSSQVVVQGAAGSDAEVKILLGNQLEQLRAKNWLINDASLTLYVDQNTVGFDTISTPFKLFLQKKNIVNNTIKYSQVKDLLSEGLSTYGGLLESSSDNKPNKYNFRITDYISDLLNGNTTYNPTLSVKVFNNPTDLPTSRAISDSLVRNFSWNPKAVMLLNHLPSNGTRKAQLKISYTKKKN